MPPDPDHEMKRGDTDPPVQVQELLDDELDLEVSVDMVSTDNHSIDSSDVVVGDLAETIYERLNELEESQYE